MGAYLLTLKLNGMIDESLPDTCECNVGLYTYGGYVKGSPVENFTTTICANPNCYIHKANYITDMLGILNIKADIGPETAQSIVMDHELKSHLDIFDEAKFSLDGINYANYLVPIMKAQKALKDINEKGGIKLGTYISLFCFSAIGSTRCEKIFAKYCNLEKFYEDMHTKHETDMFDNLAYIGRSFIGRILDISPDTDTVTNIYKTLITNKAEIMRCVKYFKIIEFVPDSTGKVKILHVTITGSITRVVADDGTIFSNRDDFPTYLTRKYGVNLIQDGSVRVKTPPLYLVCDEKPTRPGDVPPTSKKYKKAIEIKPIEKVATLMRDCGIDDSSIVITSKDFITLLDNGLLSII